MYQNYFFLLRTKFIIPLSLQLSKRKYRNDNGIFNNYFPNNLPCELWIFRALGEYFAEKILGRIVAKNDFV